MSTVHARLFSTRDKIDTEVLELELEVPEEMLQAVLAKKLTKFDLGPFGPGGIKYVFDRLDFSGEDPFIELIPSPQ